MAAIRPSIQRGGALSFVLAAAFLLFFAPDSIRAGDRDACEASPEVKAALDRLPASRGPAQTVRQFREEKLAQIQALMRRFPDDLFIERVYIGMVAPTPDRDSVIEEYRSRLERSPDDPRLAYYAGLTLFGRHTPEAIKAFETAIGEAPRFPWPRLALVDVYSSPRYRDLEKAVSNLKTFTGLCPSSLQGYIGTAQTGDPDMIREAARTLRRLLPPRRDAEALEAYATLWSLEFKSRPASEYDLLRKQIALDLKRIRALGLKETRQWYGALREGYELVDDRNGSDWARREGDRRFPRAWDLSAQEAWSRDHPPPAPHDPPEARQAYHHARLKETEKRVKERPDSTFLWSIRLEAIEHLDDVPVPEIETAVDGMLKAIEASSGDWGPGYPNLFDVARTLSEKDLQPERVVELARKGLEQIEIESHEWEDDLSVKEISDTTEFFTSSDFVQGLQLEIGGYLRLRQGDKARAELAQLDQRLQALKSLAGDRDELRKTYAAQEAAYKGLIARLEESENHKLDAMAYYEEALLSRLEAGALPATGEKDDLAVEARRLWDEMGGTQEGWDGWYGRRARALAEASRLTWSTSEQPLPLFKLVDLAGKTWRLEDLKGKVTLLNFWASW